jgi:glycosyltransferase involved in cell wall biosynthesis
MDVVNEPAQEMFEHRTLSLLSVVAPVFNEDELVDEFHARVTAALEDVPFELVLVDDGSTDGTALALNRRATSDIRPR